MEDLSSISGWQNLLDWFGHVPSFHDAEVLTLHLDRSGVSVLRIYTWNVTRYVDEKGYGIHDKHAVVSFMMEDIVDMRLEGFSAQNVIGNLKLRQRELKVPDFDVQWLNSVKSSEKFLYELTMQPCFGLSGSIQARQVRITFEAGELS